MGLLDMGKNRRLPLLLGLLAVCVALPSLAVGFAQDDYFFLSVLKGSPGLEPLAQPIWNTFTFSEGSAELNEIRMDRGIMPWWAAEGWKVDLWRPLGSLSHWFDFKVFGETPLPMHMHSAFLYGLLVVMSAFAYRSLLGLGSVAGLAGLLFAVDSAHGIPIGWLANRHSMLAGFFCIAALVAHHKWRQEASSEHPLARWFPYAILANALLALALFSGESSVAVGGYFFAYCLFMDPLTRQAGLRGFTKAFACILPYLGVVVIWRIVYVTFGHGTSGSWLYIDPISDPKQFLVDAVSYYPVMLLGLFGIPDSSVWVALPSWAQWIHVGAAVSFMMAVGVILRPLLKASAPARFLALGALLSVFPMCATIPSDRNLLLASFGAMGVVALFVESVYQKKKEGSTLSTPTRLLAGGWVGVHLILSPILLVGTMCSIMAMDNVFRTANDSVPIEVADKTVVVLNTPVDLLGASLPLFRSGRHETLPAHWWWLSASRSPVTVERINERTLVLSPEDGFLKRPYAQIFRRPDVDPLVAGDRVSLDGMNVEVLEAGSDGRPLEVRFEFDAPLESEKFVWVTWERGRYEPVDLPTVGTAIEMPGLSARELLSVALGLEATS